MTMEWLVVVNTDGTVLAVDGGAPLEWMGTRLGDRADAPDDVRRVLAEMRRQADKPAAQATMVARIGATTQPIRILALHAVPVRYVATDLRMLLQSTVGVMADQARALDAVLRLDVEPAVPQIIALDPEKIAWIITALIGNALRFVRHGTRLRAGGTIRVAARYTANPAEVVLDVQDDGSGIPADRLSRLLAPSAELLQGTALTLRLMQDVIAAHGGSIAITSSVEPDDAGTTVRLTIPCV
jgi:signal transduction histidine kinase